MDALTTTFPTPRPKRKKLAASRARRPFFRGYHRAYAALGVILLVEFSAAAVVGVLVFDRSPLKLFELGNYLSLWPGWFLLPLVWSGFLTFQLVRRRVDRPTRTLVRVMRYRSDWLLRGMLILACYPLMAKSFGVLKSAIPAINPFYLDPALADLDVWLLGDDAWRVSHALLPSPNAMVAVDRVYILWFTYVLIVTGIFSFTRDPRLQIRGALTFHCCWLLIGVILATGLASVGPIFYDRTYGGERFAELISRLHNINAEYGIVAVRSLNFLIDSVGTTKLGAGISAMPSMHVTMAFFGFLLAMHYPGKLWLKGFTLLFTAATLLGSVHLGWHYLTDGLVGIVLAYLIWVAFGRFVDASYRRPLPVE